MRPGFFRGGETQTDRKASAWLDAAYEYSVDRSEDEAAGEAYLQGKRILDFRTEAVDIRHHTYENVLGALVASCVGDASSQEMLAKLYDVCTEASDQISDHDLLNVIQVQLDTLQAVYVHQAGVTKEGYDYTAIPSPTAPTETVELPEPNL